jgi:hypothetical protein
MAKGIRVTEKEYEKIKVLCDKQLPQKMIADLTGRDPGTIGLIQQTTSYDEYIKVRRMINDRRKDRQKKPVEPLRIITDEEMNRDGAIREAIRQCNEIGIAFHKLAEFVYDNFTMEG